MGKKFQDAVENSSKSLGDLKKKWQWFSDSLDASESISEIIYLMLDESINQYPDKNQVPSELRNSKIFFKNLNNTLKSYNTIASGVSNLLPPSSSNSIEKRAGKFMTSISKDGKNVIINNAIIPKILERKDITKKDKFLIITVGTLVKEFFNMVKIKEDKGLPSYGFNNVKNYNEEITKFEKDFGIKIETYAYILAYKNIGNQDGADNLFKYFSSKNKNILELSKKAEKKFITLASVRLAKGGSIKLLIQTLRKKLYEDIKFAKIMAEVTRESSGKDILEYGGKFILKILEKSTDVLVKQIEGIVQNIIRDVPSYIFGTKALQLAGAANDIAGVAYGLGLTPSTIPIGISVDDNGEVNFREPEIKVDGALNQMVPLSGQEDTIMTLNNGAAPLIIANKNEPPVYTLAYNIIFGNDFDNLKPFIYDLKEWEDNKAIDVSMWIKKYPNDNLDIEPVFLKNIDYAHWTITPSEVAKNLKNNIIEGKSVPTLNVTNIFEGQKVRSPFPSFSFGGSPFVTQLPSLERGIFLENFNYKIYEYINAPLLKKATKVEPLDRIIFKTLNAKELKEKIYLYRYKALANSLAITNNNDFNIMVYSPLTGEEWEIVDGQTRLFDNEKYKDAEFIISDIVVSKYGKAHGYETMPHILGAFEQNLQLTEYITNSKFTVVAKEASSAKKYQFLIKANTSDFTDEQPALDLSQVIRNNELEDLFFDYLNTKVFLSSYIDNKDYIVGQYDLESYKKEAEASKDSISLVLESGVLIPPSIPKDVVEPDIIKNTHESELINNYKLKEIENYKLDIKVDIYNRVTEFKLSNQSGRVIVFDIDSYQNSEDRTTLYLSITSGIKNLIECTTINCISDEDLEKFKFRLILTSPQKLYPDSDNDNIIDSLDMFPDKNVYQFDTDRDGMPDSWETQYSLNPNDPTDASKDLNGNDRTNLEEFTDGTNPKNHLPTANAGADQTIKFGESVELDASKSTDSDGDTLIYEWFDSENESVGTGVKLVIDSLSVGEHTYSVTVSDEDATDSDKVKVTVLNKDISILETSPVYAHRGDNYALDISLDRKYAYVAGTTEFKILDISNPTNITLKSSIEFRSDIFAIKVSGNYAYIARASNLSIVDISNHSNPILKGEYNFSYASVRDVVISGNYAYIANSDDGLKIIDITDPTNPTLEGSIDEMYDAHRVIVDGSYAYIADYTQGVKIVDISNPSNPILISSLLPNPVNSWWWGISKKDNYIYLVNGHGNIDIVDVSSPSNPTLEKSIDVTLKDFGNANSIFISNNYAFTTSKGVKILDISNPLNPILTKDINIDGVDTTWGIKVVDNYAYITGRPYGMIETVLVILDFANVSDEEILNSNTIVHNGVIYKSVTSPNTDRIWLDRNLGASRVCTSFDDESCYGDYYQWGRNTDGHEKLDSGTTQTKATDINNAGSNFIIKDSANIIYDWMSTDNDGSLRKLNWNKIDGSSVCPMGYRVPTINELAAETIDLSWFENKNDAFDSFLKLPVSGRRIDGLVKDQGSFGYLWSSSLIGFHAYYIHFSTFVSERYHDIYPRGYSVRCIKDKKTTSTSNLKKTGQTTSYYPKDDGDYQKGISHSYTRDDENEVVTDNITKLMWHDDEEVKIVTKNWTYAKQYCFDLSLGLYSDWRLPTIVELLSIVVAGKNSPSIDTTAFLNYTISTKYWSSTANARYPSSLAWAVSFNNAFSGNYSTSDNYHIRCVRGGQ